MATVARLVIQASADVGAAMAQLTALDRQLRTVGGTSASATAGIRQHSQALRDLSNQASAAATGLSRVSSSVRTVGTSSSSTSSSLQRLNHAFNGATGGGGGFYQMMKRVSLVLGPTLVPAIAAFSGGVAGLVSAFSVAGAGAGAFGVAIAATFAAMRAGAPETQGLRDAIQRLKDTWVAFGVAASSDTVPVMSKALDILGQAIMKLLPLVRAMRPAFDFVLEKLNEFVNGGPFDRIIAYLSVHAPGAFILFSKIVGNVFTGLGGMIKAFLPYGMELTTSFEKSTAAFAKWGQTLDENPAFHNFIEYIKGPGRDAIDALKALGEAFLHILDAIRPISEAMIPVTKAFADVIKAMPPEIIQAIVVAWLGFKAVSGIIGILTSLTAAAAALGITVMAMLGWVAVIMAVVVAIVYLANNWDTVWNGIKAVAEAVWNFLGSKWGWLVALFGPVGWLLAIAAHWDQVWNTVKSIADTIWNALQVAWSATLNALQTAWNSFVGPFQALWSAMWPALNAIAQGVWNALQSAWAALFNAMQAIWNAFIGPFREMWNTVWPEIRQAGVNVWNQIQAAWQLLWNTVMGIWNTFRGAFEAVWGSFWNVVKDVAQGVWNAIQNAWDAFLNVFRSIYDRFDGSFRNTWSTFWNFVKDFAQGVWNVITQLWQTFTDVFTNIYNAFREAFENSWRVFWEAIKKFAEDMWNVIKGLWQAFTDAVTAILLAFTALFTGNWQKFWNEIKQFTENIWNVIRAAWQAWVDLISGILNAALEFWKTIWTNAWNAVHDIFVGVKDRILGVAQLLWDNLRNGFNAAAEGIKTVWDKVMGYVRAPVKWIIDVVWNKALGPAWNAINNIWGGEDVPTNLGQGLATGGPVRGPGTGTSDSIPVRLSNGEYVIKAASVSKYGVDMMNRINSGQLQLNQRPVIVGFAEGGEKPEPQPYADGTYIDDKGVVHLYGDPLKIGAPGYTSVSPNGSPITPVVEGAKSVGKGVVDAVTDVVQEVVAFGIKIVRGAAAEGWDKISKPLVKLAEGVSFPGLPKDSLLGKMPGMTVKMIVEEIRKKIKGEDDKTKFAGGGFVPWAPWKAGDEQQVVYGKLMNRRTMEMIKNAEKLLGKKLSVVQGSYNPGGVAASAGTHDGGGVVDIGEHDNNTVGALRASGFAAWARTVAEGFSGPHTHAVAVGDPTVSPGAAAQIDSFFRGRNGLANDGPDTFVASGAANGTLRSWIEAALRATSTPPPGTLDQWMSGLSTLVMRESGGNPNAVNNSDSNAAAGTPSKGLAQVIQPTFDTYKVAGMNNIMDPVHNLAAAIQYIKARYGSITNVQQANPNLPPKGYWRGGIAKRGWAWAGERGPELINFGRSGRVYNNQDSMQMLSHRMNGGNGSSTPTVIIGDGAIKIEIKGNATPETIDRIKDDLLPSITMALRAGLGNNN